MNFLQPLGLLGLIAVPLILFMYLLKQKHEDVHITALFLWNQAIENTLSQKPFQKLTKNILMFLQILTAILLAFSLASPFIIAKGVRMDAILVLDNSLSMQTEENGKSRFDAMKAEMETFVKNMKADDQTAIVIWGRNPYIAVHFTSDQDVLQSKLKSLTPTSGTSDFSGMASLVKSLNQQNESNVFLFSDDPKPIEGVNCIPITAGTPKENYAVVSLTHSLDEAYVTALVKIKNFDSADLETTVSLYADDELVETKNVFLPQNADVDVYFTNIYKNVAVLRAVLNHNDALPPDNEAFDIVTKRETEKVLLITEQNIFLEKMLSLLDDIELYKASPLDDINLLGYYLYIFDGYLPDELPTDGHVWAINPPQGNAFIQTTEDLPVHSMRSEGSDLLNFINDIDFSVSKAKTIEAPPWADVILQGDATPLLLAGETGNRKAVVMAFDLHNSDLPLKKVFPIFVYNLIKYFIPDKIHTRDKITATDAIEFNVLPDATGIRVIKPDGAVLTLAPPYPVPPFSDTDFSGVYILEQKKGDTTVFNSFAVNCDVKNESNLTREWSDQQNMTLPSVATNQNLTNIFLIALLLLLALEWWVYSHVL